METNGNTIGLSGSNSSNEDLSQYTDADESMSAPTEILAEFLSALMLKDYPSALKFCKIILQYEPNHDTAKQFFPLIQEKISIQAEQKHKLDNQIDECSSEDDSSVNSDENGNINDDHSDSTSTGSEQRDAEETTASYSSLEDEVVDSHTLTDNVNNNPNNDIESQSNFDLIDDNGNNVPSMSTTTTTSDSDSFPETKKVSAKLKSLLPYRKSHRYSKHVPA